MDATIVFLKQRGNCINLLIWFTKHRQLACWVGDSRALSIVENEAMAPRTVGGLARRMAHGGHIHHENYEFIGVRGPAPASTYSHSPNLRHGDLGPVARSEHTLRTALCGSIPEFTNIGGPVPSLITVHGQVFHSGNQRPMAHGELTHGMVLGGHIILGNHEIVRADGLMPITGLYPI